jgi:ectoine hydroxylase-related dioxygenase (phytanoyl-CoA dioxygenase family)
MNNRIIFNNPDFDEQFKTDGYVIVPNFLNLTEVEELKQFYKENPSENQQGFHTTIHSKNYDYRKSVTEQINERFSRKSGELLNKYKPIFACFTVKETDANSGFDLHLDWSMVDERKFSSITIWTPLLDITDENGYLWILNGSHNFDLTRSKHKLIHS